MQRMVGSLLLLIVTNAALIFACGGTDDAEVLAPSPDASTSVTPDGSSTTSEGGPVGPGPRGVGAAYCTSTFGKLTDKYLGRCCTTADQVTAEYKLASGVFLAAVPECSALLEEGLTAGRLGHDAASAGTCYPAYEEYLNSIACGGSIPVPATSDALLACGRIFIGLVPAGGGCRGDHECQDGLTCVGFTNDVDGACKLPPAINEACGRGQSEAGAINFNFNFKFGTHPKCAPGAYCAGRTCRAQSAPNGQCSSDEQCPTGNKCLQNLCSTADLSDTNGPCKASDDCKTGLYCNQPALGAAGTCQPKRADGESCSTLLVCKGRCERPDAGTTGTCKSFCGSG